MTAAQDVVDQAERLVAALTDRLGGEKEAREWVDDFEAKVTAFVQAEHEADLEQVRDRVHRFGVQSVVDRIRGRLMQTAGVPSRQALLAQLAAIEDMGGVQRG